MIHRHWQYNLVASKLLNSCVIAYPTEGVWGLGCLPESESATMKLLALKNRPWQKGLILLCSDIEQLAPYVDLTENEMQTLVRSSGKGVTYLVTKKGRVPHWISGEHDQVAVRITGHPTVKGICESVGQPIVSTSANLSGKPTAKNRFEVIRYFGEQIDYIVPGQLGGSLGPSKIIDIKSHHVIREGKT
ncbi:MAG: L-threonylcarbamoyladenylate synthase [Candidatus Azotimanducaceae bacterium]|jgi:L-threonylcarbamoyladenylate synthase